MDGDFFHHVLKVAEGGECHTKMPVEIPVEDLDYAKHRYEQKESNSSPVVSESTWRPRLSNIETIMQMEDDDIQQQDQIIQEARQIGATGETAEFWPLQNFWI